MGKETKGGGSNPFGVLVVLMLAAIIFYNLYKDKNLSTEVVGNKGVATKEKITAADRAELDALIEKVSQ